MATPVGLLQTVLFSMKLICAVQYKKSKKDIAGLCFLPVDLDVKNNTSTSTYCFQKTSFL